MINKLEVSSSGFSSTATSKLQQKTIVTILNEKEISFMAWMLVVKYNKKNVNIPEQYDVMTSTDSIMLITQDVSRFVADHVFEVEEKQGLILDGVVLNKAELQKYYNINSWSTLLKKLAPPICSELRGPFTGCVWNDDSMYAFANQTGDTAVFYYQTADCFVVSSSFVMIHQLCRKNKYTLTYDEIASNHLLSLGWIVEGHTIAKEIHRIRPGELIYHNNRILREEFYHRLDNTHPQNISIDAAVELLDAGFRKAVKRCFDKDLEYGYTHHLADMSGGLDSRMTSWVARDMGYDNITNICYAKSASNEVVCAHPVSLVLENEFIFKPLDDLSFFYDIDEMILKNYGMAEYAASTGANRLLSDICFEKFGLEHTGQLGDVVIGSYLKKGQSLACNLKLISTSDLIEAKVECAGDFENQELLALYYRGFYGILASHFIRDKYTYTVSPFIDVDFLDLCMSIPLEYRCNHVLYLRWMRTKYPKALELHSTRNISSNKKISCRSVARKCLGRYKRSVIRMLNGLQLYGLVSDPNSMNPLDYWFATTPKLQEFLSEYYEANKFRLNAYPDIKPYIEILYHGERMKDKLCALTVLGGLKNYFAE